MSEKKEMNASQALYRFVAELASRTLPITLSYEHDAGIAAELVDDFIKRHNLPLPNWGDAE